MAIRIFQILITTAQQAVAQRSSISISMRVYRAARTSSLESVIAYALCISACKKGRANIVVTTNFIELRLILRRCSSVFLLYKNRFLAKIFFGYSLLFRTKSLNSKNSISFITAQVTTIELNIKSSPGAGCAIFTPCPGFFAPSPFWRYVAQKWSDAQHGSLPANIIICCHNTDLMMPSSLKMMKSCLV